MVAIATYLQKAPNAIYTVPAGTYTGADGVFNPTAPAGKYNGWLILVAQGANPEAGNYPVVVQCTDNRFHMQAGSNKILFVNFKFEGYVEIDATDIRFWYPDVSYPLDLTGFPTSYASPLYNAPRGFDVQDSTRFKAYGANVHDCASAFNVHHAQGMYVQGVYVHSLYPSDTDSVGSDRWHTDVSGNSNGKTSNYTYEDFTFAEKRVSGTSGTAGGYNSTGVTMHAKLNPGNIVGTFNRGWHVGSSNVGWQASADPAFGTCTVNRSNIFSWGHNAGTGAVGDHNWGSGAVIHDSNVVTSAPATVNIGTNDPATLWQNANPSSSYQTFFTDIFPDTTVTPPTGFYRDRLGLSWGSYTAWSGLGSPSTGVKTIQKMIRDDRLATWARIDWGVGAPNYSAVDAQLRDHVNNGCTHIVVILNGGAGNGGQWPNCSDGNFPTTADATAFKASMTAIAQHIRVTVGSGVSIVYECGNEVTATMRDGSAYALDGTPIGPFIIGKYAYAYSLMYPALKAGDPACRVGPSSPVRDYTRIPSGAPGSDFYNMNFTAANDKARTWCSTDYFRDAHDATVGGILAYHTGTIGTAKTFHQTGYDMLFIHPYSQEGGPLDQQGAAPGVQSANTVVNTLREIKYCYDSVRILTGTRRPEFWGSEMGYSNAPYWESGKNYPTAQVVYDPPGAGSTSGVIGNPAGGTMTVPNIKWNRGTKWRATAPHLSSSANRPGVGGAPWALYTSATTYNKFEAPGVVSEENEAGQHAYNQTKVWFGELPDVDGRYISGPNAGNDQMTGVLFYFQPLDGPGPPNDSGTYNFRYGLLSVAMAEKGNPTILGPYARLLSQADTPLGTTNFGKSRAATGTSVRAVGTKAVAGRAVCYLTVAGQGFGTKSVINSVASTALVPLGVTVSARGTAFIIPPARPPDPPTIVTAVASTGVAAGYADIAWNGSPDNHGSPVIQARVTRYTSAGVRVDARVPTPATALSMRYTNLTTGTPVKFTVAWANATAGFGGESAFSNTVTPLGLAITAPDAPTGIVATATTAGVAVVTFTASVEHGSPVTGYLVTASTGEQTSTTTTTATFTGLSAGTRTFTVRAISPLPVGNSPSSASSNSITIVVPTPTGTGHGKLGIRTLDDGTRGVRSISDGTRAVRAIDDSTRTVRTLDDGTRSVRTLE